MRKSALATAGGVGAAFLASICCIGPVLMVTLGVGAGFASTFEPLRPVFGVVMLLMFAFGFYSVYGRSPMARESALDGQSCERRTGVREKTILWVGFVIAILVWTFPTWSVWLL